MVSARVSGAGAPGLDEFYCYIHGVNLKLEPGTDLMIEKSSDSSLGLFYGFVS